MKRLSIKSLTLIVFISSQLFSQNYFPFPDSNAIWNTVGENIFSSNEFRIRYGIYGDTTINSQTYHKIYYLYDTNLIHPNSTYFAALRNDNKKVIINIPGYPETVLYDFSLSEGDTIWYDIGGLAFPTGIVLYSDTHFKIVNSIDSALLGNGEYRKRWNFGITGAIMCDTWIEGIGSVEWFGLFNPLINDILLCGDNFYFACLKQNEEVVYLNNPLCEKCFCQLLTSIDYSYWPIMERLIIYPNPANKTITIDLENLAESKYYMIIHNPIGEIVFSKSLHLTRDLKINIENWAKGIYCIQLLDKNQNVSRTSKLIIN